MTERNLASHGRFGYSAIGTRVPFRWPGECKLAVYFALGVEQYALGEGMTENLVGPNPHPDVLNDSWREYGNRVGAFRILDLFARQQVPLSLLLNSAVCSHAPALVAQGCAQGCELVAHGHSNSDILSGMTEDAEAAYLRSVAAEIAQHTGQRPRGWSSPWLAETPLTPDLLKESGYDYVLDWCMDDQPVWLATRAGGLLSVPYTQEINDSSAIVGRRADAQDFADMIIDQFDELHATDDDQPLVMCVVIHSYITGQPFRLRAFRRALEHVAAHRETVWLTQPGAIASHFAARLPAPGTGR